jgi:hypothetical protein
MFFRVNILLCSLEDIHSQSMGALKSTPGDVYDIGIHHLKITLILTELCDIKIELSN